MADVDISVSVAGAAAAAAALRKVNSELSKTRSHSGKAATSVERLEHALGGVRDDAVKVSVSGRSAAAAIHKIGLESTKTNVKLKALERTMRRVNRLMEKNAMLGGLASIPKAGRGGTNSKMVEPPGVPSAPGVPGGGKGKGRGRGRGGSMKGVAGGAMIAMAAKFGTIAYVVAAIIPALVTGIASLGAGIIGLAGALAPLGGLLVAYPGYLAAVGQGFLAVKLAMAGMSDALKGLTDATMSWQESSKALSRFTGGGINKDIAKPLLKDVSGLGIAFKYVGYQVQRALVPGMRSAISMARAMIPSISTALTQTGAALSGVMQDVTGYLSSGEAQGLIGNILGRNTGIITAFGGAIKGVLRMVLQLVSAAGPMLTKMANSIGAFVNKLAGQAAAGGQSGGLARFFDSAYEAGKKVMAVVGPLFRALWNIMKIGKPLGDAILASWGKMSQNFLIFTQSAGGVKKIADWFAYMKPILWEVGYLVRDIGKVLGSWSMAPGFIEMSQMIRRDLLPVIEKFVTSTAESFLPVLMQLVEAILKILTAWQSASATALVVKALAAYLEALGRVLSDTGGLISKFLTLLLALFAVMKIGAITVKLLGPAFLTLRAAFIAVSTGARTASLSIKAFFLSIKSSLISTGIGAIVVGIGFMLEALMSASSAKDDEIAKNKEWAASLYEVNGQLSKIAAQTTAQALKDTGAYDLATKLNISGADVVKAAMNDATALATIRGRYDSVYAKWEAKMDSAKTGQGRGAVYNEMLRDEEYKAAKKLMEIVDPMAVAFVAEGKAAEYAAKAGGTWNKSLEDLSASGDVVVDKTGAMVVGMDKLTLATLKAVDAFQKIKGLLETSDWNIGRRADARSIKGAIKEWMKAKKLKDLPDAAKLLLGFGEKGDAVRSASNAYMSRIVDRAQAFYDAGNKPQALKVLETGTQKITKMLAKAFYGGDMAQGEALAKKLFGPAFKELARLKKNLGTIVSEEERISNIRNQKVPGRYEGSTFVPYGTPGTKTPQGAMGKGGYYNGSQWVEGGRPQKQATMDEINAYVAQQLALDATKLNTTAQQDNTAALQTLNGYLKLGNTPVQTPASTTGAVPNVMRPGASSIPLGTSGTVNLNLGSTDIPNIDLTAPNLGLPEATKTNVTLPGVKQAITDLTMTKTLMTWINNNPVGTVVVPKNVPKEGVWSGGPVEAGWKGWVGELGPEAFIDRAGRMSIIGKNGPEVKQFSSSGYVIPNDQLVAATSASTRQQIKGGTTADGGGDIHVHIGSIQQANEFDVVQAVRKAVREAERDRRERG